MFITFTIGLLVGGCLGIVLVAVFNGNRAEETEDEMRRAYKSGYTNGYDAAEKRYKTR